MRMKTLCSVMVGLSGVVASVAANAQPAGAPPAAEEPAAAPAAAPAAEPAAAASASKMRVGLNLVPMPVGSLKGSGTSVDLKFAFGVLPFFDYSLTPNFFIGIEPQYTFNVKPKSATGDAGKELDILLRVGGGAPVADKIQIYGYLSPGYSVVYPPTGSNASGLALGVHAGGMMDLSPTMFLNAELGYQLGFQKVSVGGTDFDTKFNYFQIGLGGGIRL